ncbi:MAG TPA: DUF255 domain-containing protein [Dehalococcoidia bacterium]|nr:DUF255 domain-containing protein [Dehalococcoidia bacterium]
MAEGSTFHFSPRPNRASEIGWNEWGADAFARAAREDKPVLLGISAVWCHWCHVMDETSYSDADVIGLINERFVPIRVDNDQRPDINARYNMGGWPTTAFLTPKGELMAGMTYVPPEQMRDVLGQVSTYYRDNKQDIEEKLAQIIARRSQGAGEGPGDELSDQIFQDALHSTEDGYDPVFGGFGNEPKFPHSDAVDLLLHAYLRDGDRDALHMARKTLEYMCQGGTYDQEWGGFYRYATKRDWSVPHYEKMLEDNAGLLRNLLGLYRISDDAGHRRYIEFTIAYLDAWLSDPTTGAFYGSQDADEEFYPLPNEERKQRHAPYVDRTVYTSWNAMAISAYLEASWTLGLDAPRDRALRALDLLWERLHDDRAGMYRYLGADGPRIGGLLGDQAYTALALLDAYEAAGRAQDLDRARELARFMTERLGDEGGGFFDTPGEHESLGLLSARQKPVKENTAAAEVLTRLGRLTGDGSYTRAAETTLRQFSNIIESQGYFAAGYAVAVDRFLNPGADVKIVGAPSDAGVAQMRTAALGLLVPDRIVRVLDASDRRTLEAEGLPPEPSPAAYVCYGTLCSAPVTAPSDLIEITERTRQAHEGTRRAEPLAGPRGGGRATD